jgi:hypothetical protein
MFLLASKNNKPMKKNKFIISVAMMLFFFQGNNNVEAQFNREGVSHQRPANRPPIHSPSRLKPPRPHLERKPPYYRFPNRPYIMNKPHSLNSFYHGDYHYLHPMPHPTFHNRLPIGTVVATLAASTLATAIATNVATALSQPIYYNDGTFYRQNTDGYVVISPPMGYAVYNLPSSAQVLKHDGVTYYYFDGTFYKKQIDKFVVVSAPVGCVVMELPANSEEKEVNGQVYYWYNGTYYMPVYDNGYSAYQVIDNL